MKHILTLLVLLTFFTVSYSQSVAELIKQADEFTEEKFDNMAAIKTLEKALAKEPGNFDIAWRLSRAYVDYAEHLPSKTDEEKDIQLKNYEKSFEYANKAIQLNGGNMIGYLRRAIANGRIALFKGVFNSISLVKEVKADLEKAIALNNAGNIHYSVALYVLARTHAKVAEKSKVFRWPLGLGWADRDEAANLFEKAIKLRPDFIMFRLDAARNYIELDEFDKAKEHLNKIATLPKLDEDDDTFKQEAKKLLESIKNN